MDLASKYGNHLEVVGLVPFFVFVQQSKLFSDSTRVVLNLGLTNCVKNLIRLGLLIRRG